MIKILPGETMAEVTIALRNGQRVSFEVDVGGKASAFFVLGVRKSGSTLLNKIAAELARLNRRRFVNVGDKFFRANVLAVNWQFDSALQEIVHPANVYGGFREMPLVLLAGKLFERAPKILMVRDPRDALVSEYFSNAYSHPIPNQTAESSDTKAMMERQRQQALTNGPDKFVLDRALGMTRTMMEFGTVVKSPTTLVVKYEDCIFNKRQLICGLAQHFGWQVGEESTAEILGWADVRPQAEDPHAFIRKVTPGDHREKLRPATITALNGLLAPAMKLFDYPTDP